MQNPGLIPSGVFYFSLYCKNGKYGVKWFSEQG